MWPRYGIKLGNSTVCVACAKDDGKLEVIANKHGDRVSQACLLCETGDNGGLEVGLTARQKGFSKAGLTIANSFQFFPENLNESQIEKAKKYITCGYNEENGEFELTPSAHHEGEERRISPYEVSVEFLKAGHELVKQCHLSDDHPAVVLSIPLYYPLESWDSLAKATEEAGFHVVQIIPEPTAALLAYELDKQTTAEVRKKNVLCIKSGGLLTSFTHFEIHNGLYSIVNFAGPLYIGGIQFSDTISDFICDEFNRKYKLDPHESRRAMAKIRTAAENCKHILTTLQTTQVYIDSLMDGIDFNLQLSRARFDSLIQPACQQFSNIFDKAMLEMNLPLTNSDDIKFDAIVLSGGNMKIPKLQSTISNRFENVRILSHLPPDEVVALGCARQTLFVNDIDVLASEESSSISNLSVLKNYRDMNCSITKHDIFVWCDGNVDSKQLIVEKGTLLPNEIVLDVQKLECPNSNEKVHDETVSFSVETSQQIGKISINNPPKPLNGVYRVKAIVEDINGFANVTLSVL